MKVSKSTAICAEYNAQNAEGIAAGLVEGWEPDARTLAAEESLRLQAEAEEARKVGSMKMAKQIWDSLPAEAKQMYHDPTKDSVTYSDGTVRFRPAGSYTYFTSVEVNRRNGTWRVEVEPPRINRHGRSSVASSKYNAELNPLKDFILTPKKLAAVCGRIAQHAAARMTKLTAEVRAKEASDRFKLYLAHPGGKELLMKIAQTTYISEYTDGFAVAEDGRVTYKDVGPFTAEQWEGIIALREQHAEEMKALLASYKEVNTTS